MTTTIGSAPFTGAGSTNLKDYATPVGFGTFSVGGLATGLHVDVTGGVAVVNSNAGFMDVAKSNTDLAHDAFEFAKDMMRGNVVTAGQVDGIIFRGNNQTGAQEDECLIQWTRVDDNTVSLHIVRINQGVVQQDSTVNATFAWAKNTWMRLGAFVYGSTVWLFTEPQGGGARTVHGSLVLSGTGGDFNDTNHQRFGMRCNEYSQQWDNFTVTLLPLTFTGAPTLTVAGSVIAAPVVKLMDTTLATVLTTFTANVAMAIGVNPGGGTLSGTTPKTASAGVATFADLSINKSGVGYTLVASSSGVDSGTSSAFTIIGGAMASVSVTTPTGSPLPAGVAFALGITAHDALGNIATYTGLMTVAIHTNPASGTLAGTLSKNAVAGVVSFADLTIDNAGAGYVLRVTAV